MSRERVLTHSIVFRVPDDLYEVLRRDAQANARTISETVRLTLRKVLLKASER